MCLALLASSASARVVVSGTVMDGVTGEALFPATIRVGGTNVATVTNSDGRFEISVSDLPVMLLCSHIGFRTDTLSVRSVTSVVFALAPVMYEMEELVVSAEDPAISIMRKVIERKLLWKDKLTSLKANAYTRITLRKDSTIVSVIESMSEAFWLKERGWREILKAKRTTRNMEEDVSLPAAAFMDNFYEDDILIAGHTLQGITHPDALETYDFSMTGRRKMDDRTVYDISVSPKSPRSSAFEGTIAVLDEVYALLDVSLRPNGSFIFPPPFRQFDIGFRQQFRSFDDMWLPVDLRTETFLDIGILGLSFPPIRSEQVTRISDYEVNPVLPDSLFRSKKAVIHDVSSKSAPDSLLESAGVVIPLTAEEQLAFDQIDSTATLEKVFKPKGALARLIDDDDSSSRGNRKKRAWRTGFNPRAWFNRVDEAYIGVQPQLRSSSGRTRFRSEVGYATGLTRWTFGGDVRQRWGSLNGLLTRIGYRRGSSPRQSKDLYPNFSASTGLFGGEDYYDHYWREQFVAEGSYRVRKLHTNISSGLRVERHSSLAKTTDYAILFDTIQRPNPAIDEGDLRSLTLKATYDEDLGPAAIVGQKKLRLWVEHSQPGLLDSDFDFTQVRFQADWRFETFFARRMMPNTLDVTLVTSFSTGGLPVQRFGHLDASLERWHTPGTFRALHANPYEGEHAFGVFWEHHFRTLPFEYLGWGALVRRNIGIIVFGGHGRTWISDERLASLTYSPQYVDRFHHEIGASVNGLFGLLRLDFAKRLDTSGYTVGFGIARIF
jgi:hypothetical protein